MKILVLTVLIMAIPMANLAAQPSLAPGKTGYFYVCDAWSPEEPVGRWAVMDLCFCGYDGSYPYLEPTESQREAIRTAGGKILYEFNIPCLRARMPIAAVPAFVQDPCWTEPVAHIRDYPAELMIKIPVPLSSEDRAFLLSLGASDIREFNRISWIFVVVPDAAVPAIRQHATVERVEPNFKGCPLLGPREGVIPSESSHHGTAEGHATWGRLKSAYR